jgi:16S rRNA processing protein RimM
LARAVAPETTPPAQGFVTIGRIVRAHGVSGETSYKPDEAMQALPPIGLEVWFVPPPEGARTARVASVRPGPKGPLVHFTGIDDVASASALRGAAVLARRAELPAALLAASPFDPIGLVVEDQERGPLGTVRELIVTGANDVWVVDGPLGEVLIPAIADVVISVDEPARTALVRLLPGLIDEDAEP